MVHVYKPIAVIAISKSHPAAMRMRRFRQGWVKNFIESVYAIVVGLELEATGSRLDACMCMLMAESRRAVMDGRRCLIDRVTLGELVVLRRSLV